MDVGTSTQTYTLGDLPKCSGERNTPSSDENNAPCFAVCALVCDLSPKGECVPAFACESERRTICAGGVEVRVIDALETLV